MIFVDFFAQLLMSILASFVAGILLEFWGRRKSNSNRDVG